MSIPSIFNESLRAKRRDRAAARFEHHDFLYAAMADELLDRLEDVSRNFARALVIGCPDARLAQALAGQGCAVTCADTGSVWAKQSGGAVIQEDRPTYPAQSFDLILCCGTLDSLNDLPGALIALNHLLEPDGLLLLCMVGAGSLARLRSALLAADGDKPAQRIHPQVDVRALGDLLARAGFTMPVADSQVLDVRYGSLFALLADLRGMGAAQCLASSPPPLTRAGLALAAAQFANAADADGRTSERFVIVHGSGWRASEKQPRPARRGSAKMSLAQALSSPAARTD